MRRVLIIVAVLSSLPPSDSLSLSELLSFMLPSLHSTFYMRAVELKLERDWIKMADKARPCPCTNPELPQFEWVSTVDPITGRGKRLLLYTTSFLFML